MQQTIPFVLCGNKCNEYKKGDVINVMRINAQKYEHVMGQDTRFAL
jgi:GTPase SAR1 family protein